MSKSMDGLLKSKMETLIVDIPSAILEEIALEGLDGITCSALWIRLSMRKGFFLDINESSKMFIWKLIQEEPSVQVFLLKDPRPPLIIYNRYEHVDPELESIFEPEKLPEDIYPVYPVEDKEKGIRGSCATYLLRQDVTVEIRKLPLYEVLTRYGERMVLVASQDARNAALGGHQSYVVANLVISSYIILERIGRSRELGEVTQGKCGLSRLNIPPKSAFYFRKKLLEDYLIVKQPISMRVNNRNVLGTLLHLPKFYCQRLPKILVLIRRIVEILKETGPLYMMDHVMLKARLNTSVQLKKIFGTNELRKYVSYDEKVPYRTLFPDAQEKDWKLRSGDGERLVKIVRLLDPSLDPEDLFKGDEIIDEASSDGEDDEISSSEMLNRSTVEHYHPLTTQAYRCVEAAGPSGLKQKELAERLGLNQLDARCVLRVLVRLGLVDYIVKDMTKNRVFVYVAIIHVHNNDIRTLFQQEQQKIQKLIKFNNNNLSEESTVESSLVANNALVGMETALEKDVSQMAEEVVDDKGLFRSNNSRRILAEEGTVSDLTHRSLKRANIILEAIQNHQVIEETGVLLRLIGTEEAKDGCNVRMDRKSLKRLLVRLANEGQIKNIRIILRCGNRERILEFICHPSITMANSVIRSAIEQAKLKLFCISKQGLARYSMKSMESEPLLGTFSRDEPIREIQSLTNSVQQMKEHFQIGPPQNQNKLPVKMIHNSWSGRIYGAEPKCVRVRELHRLLFYLIYGYEGSESVNQTEALSILKNEVVDLNDENISEIPRIYKVKLGWQMFIPPLPQHGGWPYGWAFLCDILLRIPLSLFVKVVNITYVIEGLTEYLQHPVKQHLLLAHLPLQLRQGLIYARKYIFSVHEVITNMVYLGLAQFGPHNLKEKDQVFIYLNRRASIMDTTSSPPGYHHIAKDRMYERKNYSFETMDDLDNYWYDVWNICSHTPLGSVNTVAGQSITLELLKKKPAMVEATRPRQPEEGALYDNGKVPGDHLGAAGFDSALFTHLKRNWTYNRSSVMSNRLALQIKNTGNDNENGKQHENPPLVPGRLTSLRDKASRFAMYTTKKGTSLQIPVTTEPKIVNENRGFKRKRSVRHITTTPLVSWSNLEQTRKGPPTTAPAAKTRIVKAREHRISRRPYYDEVDRAALRLMRRLRATWSPSEDSFLLLCKVAATFLNSNLRYSIIPFFVIRDFLHENLKESRNKTSRACQRRVNYMMRNPSIVYQVETAVEEICHDPEILALFQDGPLSKAERAKLGVDKLEGITIERFRKLMEFLTSRYSQASSSASVPGTVFPATTEEFYCMYSLAFPQATLRQRRPLQDVKNVVDIHCSVVYNVIHSSLCTTEDKASWAFQLFKIYQQYPDILLRSTLAKMKSDMMIAQKKKTFGRTKTLAQLPLSACPYKLSITYVHLFLSRYQFEVYNQTYNNLKCLLTQQKNRGNEEWCDLEIGRIHEGGNAAMVVTLLAHCTLDFVIQIPDQVIVFDPSIQDRPQQFGNLLERYRNLLRDATAAAEAVVEEETIGRRKRKRFGLAATAASTDLPKLVTIGENVPTSENEDVSCANTSRVRNQLLIRTASRIALHMMREELSQESKSSSTIPPSHLQDFFVLNACKLLTRMKQPSNKTSTFQFLNEIQRRKVLESIPATVSLKGSLSTLRDLYNRSGYDEQVKSKAVEILQIISLKRELGLPLSEMIAIFGRLEETPCSLEQHVRLMIEGNAVLKIGLVATRLVAVQHAHPWLVKSFKLTRLTKEKVGPLERTANANVAASSQLGMTNELTSSLNICEVDSETLEDSIACNNCSEIPKKKRKLIGMAHSHQLTKKLDCLEEKEKADLLVLMKPWIRIDGSLNRRVLDRLLGAVLSHVLQKPGSTLVELAERFHPAIQPHHVRELVEILENIGCLELITLSFGNKPSLFSPVLVNNIGKVDMFTPEWKILCKPKVEAVVRLGEFIGDKLYEKDYIPLCSCHGNSDV